MSSKKNSNCHTSQHRYYCSTSSTSTDNRQFALAAYTQFNLLGEVVRVGTWRHRGTSTRTHRYANGWCSPVPRLRKIPQVAGPVRTRIEYNESEYD